MAIETVQDLLKRGEEIYRGVPAYSPGTIPEVKAPGTIGDVIPGRPSLLDTTGQAAPANLATTPTAPTDTKWLDDLLASQKVAITQPTEVIPTQTKSIFDIPKELSKGVASGAIGFGEMAGGIAALGGAKETGKGWIEASQKAAEPYAGKIASYKDIPGESAWETVTNAALYAAHGVGTIVPTIGLSMLSGGLGAIIARGAAKTMIAKEVSRLGVEGLVANVSKAAGKDLIGKAATKASLTSAGAIAGGGVASLGMELGQIGQMQLQEGEMNLGKALLFAAPAAMLDVIPQWHLAKRIGLFGTDKIGTITQRLLKPLEAEAVEKVPGFLGKTIPQRMLKQAALQFAEEAPTEGMQTVLERMGAGLRPFDAQGVEDVVNSFLIGGMGGAVFGGAGGMLSKGTRARGVVAPVDKPAEAVIAAREKDVSRQVADMSPAQVLDLSSTGLEMGYGTGSEQIRGAVPADQTGLGRPGVPELNEELLSHMGFGEGPLNVIRESVERGQDVFKAILAPDGTQRNLDLLTSKGWWINVSEDEKTGHYKVDSFTDPQGKETKIEIADRDMIAQLLPFEIFKGEKPVTEPTARKINITTDLITEKAVGVKQRAKPTTETVSVPRPIDINKIALERKSEGEPFFHVRYTGKRVRDLLSPDDHQGFTRGEEANAKRNVPSEVFVPRTYAFKLDDARKVNYNVARLDKVVNGTSLYVGQTEGKILPANSREAKVLWGRAQEQLNQSMEAPGDKGMLKEFFFKEALKDGYTVIDRENQQGYIFLGKQKVRPIQKESLAHPQPKGYQVTSPVQYYHEAQGTSNVLVRQSNKIDNSDRTLFVQFSSEMLMPQVPDATSNYYTKLYSGAREGFTHPTDFWEIPQWMAVGANSLPNSDVYVIRNVDEAVKFFNEAGYKNIAFSVLDVNEPFVRDIAANYKGNIVAGGYADLTNLRKMNNVKVFDDIQSFVRSQGLEPKVGTDYRHFEGTQVIPRLTLSNGCLHKCNFCDVTPHGRIIEASADDISRQVASFKDLGARLVYLNDKTFGQAKNFTLLESIYKDMKEYNPDFVGFIVQTSPAQMEKLSPSFISRAGIKYIEIGVESYNDFILKEVHKPATTALIDKSIEKIRQSGAWLIPNIIIGLPHETAETYRNTMNFLYKNKDIISHVNAYNLALYKGTELQTTIGRVTEADQNENIITKSFHTDPAIHEQFANDVFNFANEQLDKPLGATLDPDTAMFRRGVQVNGTARSLTYGRIIQYIADKAPMDFKFNVVNSIEEIPQNVRDFFKITSEDPTVKALYDRAGKGMYILAQNITSARDLQTSMVHELFGHYAVEQYLGVEYFDFMLNRVFKKYGASGLADIATTYNLDLTKPIDQFKASCEKVAELSESGTDPNLIARVYAYIRTALYNLGFTGITLSDAEIKTMLYRSRQLVESERAGQNLVASMVPMEGLPLFRKTTPTPVTIKEQYAYRNAGYSSSMSPNDRMLVAKNPQGVDVGFIWYTQVPGGFEVRKIEVAEKRKGIATQLMDTVLQEGTFQGATAYTEEGKKFFANFTKGKVTSTEQATALGKSLTESEAITVFNQYKDAVKEPLPSDMQQAMNKAFDTQMLRETLEGYLNVPKMQSLTEADITKRFEKIIKPNQKFANITEQDISDMPLFRKFYRGGPASAMPEGTALDVIKYEREELGNNIKVTPGTKLDQIPAKSLQWVTLKPEDASEYGDTNEIIFDHYKIVAKDNYGGLLIENLDYVKQQAQIESAWVKGVPLERRTPSDTSETDNATNFISSWIEGYKGKDKYFDTPRAKDLQWLMKDLLGLPHWIAMEFPEFEKVADVQWDRVDNMHEDLVKLLQDPDTSAGENPYLTLAQAKGTDRIDKLIVWSDYYNVLLTDQDLRQKSIDLRLGELTPQEVQAYQGWDKGMKRAREYIQAKIKEIALMIYENEPWGQQLTGVMNGTIDPATVQFPDESQAKDFALALKATQARFKLADSRKAQMDSLNFYMPRVRDKGDFVVTVFVQETGEDGQVKEYKLRSERRETAIDAEKLRLAFSRNPDFAGLRITKEEVKATSEYIYQGVDVASLNEFLDRSVEAILKKGKITSEQADLLFNAVSNSINEEMAKRGAEVHFLHRSGTFTGHVIQGYQEEKLGTIFHNYMSGMSGALNKLQAAYRFHDAIRAINPDQTKLFEYANRYMKDMLRNPDSVDRKISQLKTIPFAWYLIGNLRMSAAQFAQNWMTAAPILSRSLNDWKVGGPGATARILSAQLDIARKSFSPVEKAMLDQAFNQGSTNAMLINEMKGKLEGNWAKNKANWLINLLAIPFSGMESFNRKSALLAMFRAAQESGMGQDRAFREAKKFVRSTHYAYGLSNMPQLLRDGTTLSKYAGGAYTFRSFTHNYLLSMRYYARDSQGKLVLGFLPHMDVIGRSLAALALMGGLAGTPFIDDILDEMEKLTAIPYRSNMRKVLHGIGGQILSDVGMAGLPAIVGVDLSGSMKIGVPFIGSTGNEIWGVWGGLIDSGKKAIGQVSEGSYLRALETVSPVAIQAPLKGLRMGTEGMKTASGKDILDESGQPVKMTTREAITQAAAFRPVRLSQIQGERRVEANVEATFKERRMSILEHARKAKTTQDFKKLARDITNFNLEVSKYGGLIPPIRSLRDALKPDTRYMKYRNLQYGELQES